MLKCLYWCLYFRGARDGSNETRALSYNCKESTLVSSAWLEGRAILGSVWRPRLGASAVCFGLRAMCYGACLHWRLLPSGFGWGRQLCASPAFIGLRAMCYGACCPLVSVGGGSCVPPLLLSGSVLCVMALVALWFRFKSTAETNTHATIGKQPHGYIRDAHCRLG